jgi:hypothetical protein
MNADAQGFDRPAERAAAEASSGRRRKRAEMIHPAA